jgi:hypothetical protein
MSTLSLRAPHASHVWPGFARIWQGIVYVGGVIAAVIDVFAEAQMQASAAHKAYPFIDR